MVGASTMQNRLIVAISAFLMMLGLSVFAGSEVLGAPGGNGNGGNNGQAAAAHAAQDQKGVAANSNGANSGCGNYCPNNVGAPSQNGNGGGQAVGRPGQGTVGNADSKNPPGQFPDGSDSNKGYECDQNNGIGKGNPAHTGCVRTTKPPENPPVTPPGQGGGTPQGEVTPPAPTPVVSASIPAIAHAVDKGGAVPEVQPAELPETGSYGLLEMLLAAVAGVVAYGSTRGLNFLRQS